MVLLKQHSNKCSTSNSLALHSTMVLLKLSPPIYTSLYKKAFTFHYGLIKTFLLPVSHLIYQSPLHSTMVLLKQCYKRYNTTANRFFTFHYGLIKTRLLTTPDPDQYSFTFHYGLIKTLHNSRLLKKNIKALHSTMVLLKQRKINQKSKK